MVRSFYNLNPKKDGNEDQIIQKCLCMTGSKLIDIKWNKMYEAAKFKLQVTPNNTARKRLLQRGELFMYSFVYFLVDICKNYQKLTDADRKSNYPKTDSPKCDQTLNGWYRFQGAASTKMETTCPRMYSCGTSLPAWLSENHPTVADGKVQKKVCIRWFGDCCWKYLFIQVKNCGSFYIYDLFYPGMCAARYCGTD